MSSPTLPTIDDVARIDDRDEAAQEPGAADAARENGDLHAAASRGSAASTLRVRGPSRDARRARSATVSTSSTRFGASTTRDGAERGEPLRAAGAVERREEALVRRGRARSSSRRPPARGRARRSGTAPASASRSRGVTHGRSALTTRNGDGAPGRRRGVEPGPHGGALAVPRIGNVLDTVRELDRVGRDDEDAADCRRGSDDIGEHRLREPHAIAVRQGRAGASGRCRGRERPPSALSDNTTGAVRRDRGCSAFAVGRLRGRPTSACRRSASTTAGSVCVGVEDVCSRSQQIATASRSTPQSTSASAGSCASRSV